MRSIIIIVVCFISFSSALRAQSSSNSVRLGNYNYKKEKYNKSEMLYRQALDKKPGMRQATFNLGNALYKQEEYEAATVKYEDAIKMTDDIEKLSNY
jgi:tetratricopeptide (TPR) repeat protein